ncbi:hypothetical protein GCM10027431_32750 [Lysobacter rhizosphaerae]
MSIIDQNLPSPIDRLGLLLEHAQGMAMAMTADGFDEICENGKAGLYDALVYTLMDANQAFTAVVNRMPLGKVTK